MVWGFVSLRKKCRTGNKQTLYQRWCDFGIRAWAGMTWKLVDSSHNVIKPPSSPWSSLAPPSSPIKGPDLGPKVISEFAAFATSWQEPRRVGRPHEGSARFSAAGTHILTVVDISSRISRDEAVQRAQSGVGTKVRTILYSWDLHRLRIKVRTFDLSKIWNNFFFPLCKIEIKFFEGMKLRIRVAYRTFLKSFPSAWRKNSAVATTSCRGWKSLAAFLTVRLTATQLFMPLQSTAGKWFKLYLRDETNLHQTYIV